MKLLCRSTLKRMAPQSGVDGAETWNEYKGDAVPLYPTPAGASAGVTVSGQAAV